MRKVLLLTGFYLLFCIFDVNANNVKITNVTTTADCLKTNSQSVHNYNAYS